jgi:hypothetical protein
MNNELQIQIIQNLVPVLTAEIQIGNKSGANVVFGDTLTGAGTPSDPVNVSEDILQQISDNTQSSQDNASEIQNLQNTIGNISSQLSDVQSVIPATASTQNQLADQGFVNSSIQTATAYFRGDWATWSAVPSDPSQYPADATGNRTPITNDYMVVIADEQENGGTWRYKYTGDWSEQGKDGWLAEYQVNETPFTAAQNAAINSGITASAVADIAAMKTGKQDKLVAGPNITINGNTISATSGTTLPAQTGNAGKFLMTDGTTASWSDKPLVNNATSISNLAIGVDSSVAGNSYGTAVGYQCKVNALYSQACAYGMGQIAAAKGSIQIGVCKSWISTVTNSDPDTFKVSNTNGNFEMMDADGNVPLGRLTYVTNQIGDISTALTAILGE